jgi:LPXTG-site transpeptidase (sortase) family protein
MPTESPEPTETPEPTPSPEPTPTPTPAPTGKLYERVPGIEMPGEKVNGHEYIGTLSIPSLGLKVPVQRNWSYENLSVSPCRYSGSAYAGNLAIIAHTYHFGKLSSLALDATVTFTDMENNVFRYVVREKNMISPNDANEIAHSDYDLTLVTCTISGTKRVAVYCERVK